MTEGLLKSDLSVHSFKMAKSHISMMWKYFTVVVAFAFSVL